MAYWDDITNAFEQFKQGFSGTMDATNPLPKGMSESLNKDIQDMASWVNQSRVGKLVAQGAQTMQDTGADYGIPVGMLAKNFRSPVAIQELRKLMAEEIRSRGPIVYDKTRPGNIVPIEYGGPGTDFFTAPRASELTPNPIELILRGSWYHGMSKEARNKLFGDLPSTRPGESALIETNRQGFPISHHDIASISNKLGEPSGVSISMLPTKAQQFSADEIIHRVQPQYGGPPTERTVNLMSAEGRKALNDAYDVVANKEFSKIAMDEPLINSYGRDINNLYQHSRPSENINAIENILNNFTTDFPASTGSFNKQLSEQLQSQGKRGILYNPQRWNEYEMLVLDPKYVLPLDYRMFQEYANPTWARSKAFASEDIYAKAGGIDVASATPGTHKGLSQIQDLMSQNKSRLGDIYSERPWTQRLSDENKRRLLDLIDPQYREVIGNQLYE